MRNFRSETGVLYASELPVLGIPAHVFFYVPLSFEISLLISDNQIMPLLSDPDGFYPVSLMLLQLK